MSGSKILKVPQASAHLRSKKYTGNDRFWHKNRGIPRGERRDGRALGLGISVTWRFFSKAIHQPAAASQGGASSVGYLGFCARIPCLQRTFCEIQLAPLIVSQDRAPLEILTRARSPWERLGRTHAAASSNLKARPAFASKASLPGVSRQTVSCHRLSQAARETARPARADCVRLASACSHTPSVSSHDLEAARARTPSRLYITRPRARQLAAFAPVRGA